MQFFKKIKYDNISLYVDLGDWMGRFVLYTSIMERIRFIVPCRISTSMTLVKKIKHLFSTVKNPVLVDVGCHIGSICLPVAREYPDSVVIGIEAHPRPANVFIENIKLNGLSNVKLYTAAMSDTHGLVEIHALPGNSGGSRISGFSGRDDYSKDIKFGNVIVPTITLEELWDNEKLECIDILKIDVEGHDKFVLMSAGPRLNPEYIKCVICEYAPESSESASVTGWELVSYMRDAGYRCEDLHRGINIDNPSDIPVLPPDNAVTDFIFFPMKA